MPIMIQEDDQRKNKIKDIILFLENNGLLVKSNYYEKVGQNGSLPVPRMRIVEVNTKVKGAQRGQILYPR